MNDLLWTVREVNIMVWTVWTVVLLWFIYSEYKRWQLVTPRNTGRRMALLNVVLVGVIGTLCVWHFFIPFVKFFLVQG